MKHWEHVDRIDGYEPQEGIKLTKGEGRLLGAYKSDDGKIHLIEQCDRHFEEGYTVKEIEELAKELIKWAKTK